VDARIGSRIEQGSGGVVKRGATDPALEQLVAALRAGDLDFTGSIAIARGQFEDMLAQIPVADDLSFAAEDLAGLPTLVGRGPAAASDIALLYLHGGAYVAGSAKGYRGLAGELARAAGATAYAVEYRLAPEHPFPAAVEDAVAAYHALLDRGFAPDAIVFAGDSAGGGLVVATLVALRDAGTALPAAAVLISPWADLGCDGGSYVSKAVEDPALTQQGLRAAAAHYLGDADPRQALASPIYADLRGLPPLLVQVGSAEVLLDDAIALAGAAGAAGVAVRLEIWPGMVHVWHAFGFMLEAGRRAIADAGGFLKDALQARSATGETPCPEL
jgi:acetyl esterase/lipase